MGIPKVCVISVTYGNRFGLLEQVIAAAFECGAAKFIVVDNHSDADSRQRLAELQKARGGDLDVVSCEENIGSAGGFKIGLEHFHRTSDADFFWLLDDDNKPLAGALAALLRDHGRLAAGTKPGLTAAHSVRPSYAARLAAGISIPATTARPSSFMEFELTGIARRLWAKWQKRRARSRGSAAPVSAEPIALPYCPYGGLLMHRTALDLIGYPDERFFVYCDDKEYTYRLTKAGGTIYLTTDSHLEDIDPNWATGVKGVAMFTRFLLGSSTFRVFYSVRNHAYFDRHKRADNRLMFLLNKWTYLGLLKLFAIYYGAGPRFALVRRAIAMGEAGRLGRMPEWENP